MILKVHTFTGRVRRNENAEGMFLGGRIEGTFNLLTGLIRHSSVKSRNPRLTLICEGNRGTELLFEIAFRVRVLGENNDPTVVPGWGIAFGRGFSKGWKISAHILANPIDKPPDSGIGYRAEHGQFGTFLPTLPFLFFF